MNRDEILRFDEVYKELEFFLIGMSRGMDVGNFFVNDFCALPIEAVYDMGDRLFIAGNKARAEYDRIPLFDPDVLVSILCHPGQGR